MKRFRRLGFAIFCFLCAPALLLSDTVLLKDGSVIRNVRVKMGGDQILVEDESGNIRKIETTSVKKIVMAEVRDSQSADSASQAPSSSSPSGDSKRENPPSDSSKMNRVAFSSGVSFWETKIGEPDRIGSFSVRVQSIFLQAETRFEGRYGITLAFENSRFDFQSSSNVFFNPRVAGLILPGQENIQKTEFSSMLLGITSLSQGYTPFRTENSFRIETISFLPGLKYYLIDGKRFSWFGQFAFGFGKSTKNGMYSEPFFQGTLLAGTGVQWNADPVFLALSIQIRNTLLSNPNFSYRFTEPSLQFSFGIRI